MQADPALGPAIDVRPLFARQHAAFVELLGGLDAASWDLPTACPGWSVKDVAAHVLGDHVSRLSRHRDSYHHRGPGPGLGPGPGPGTGTGTGTGTGETLPSFLDRLNAEWVAAARRMSPRVLLRLLSVTGNEIAGFWQTVDMAALGEAVSWAGPGPAPVWLDAARDFSEYWTHHQQICDATGRPGLDDPEYLRPVLDTFLRALPRTLHSVTAPEGAAVMVTVTGPAGGDWCCRRDNNRWLLQRTACADPAARIEFDPDTAWRLCTRGITPSEAARRARGTGDPRLSEAVLQMVSIIHADLPPQHGPATP